MTAIPAATSAITLFVEDLAAATAFYESVLDQPIHDRDDASTVFAFGRTLVYLLDAREAPELVEPAPVARPDAGVRRQLTITVPDVDAAAAAAVGRGATLLNGPVDRPWGIRTAAFRDPAGHTWGLASA